MMRTRTLIFRGMSGRAAMAKGAVSMAGHLRSQEPGRRPMRKRLIWAIVSLSTALAGNAMADVLEGMQGAWTMEGTDCAATFKTVDGQVRFTDLGGSTTTGIIIAGDKITGPNASCTARKLKKYKDHMTVSLSCADAI